MAEQHSAKEALIPPPLLLPLPSRWPSSTRPRRPLSLLPSSCPCPLGGRAALDQGGPYPPSPPLAPDLQVAEQHYAKETVEELKYSPDGTKLAAGSHDNFIDIYDVTRG